MQLLNKIITYFKKLFNKNKPITTEPVVENFDNLNDFDRSEIK